MWESKIYAFLNHSTNEYIILNSEGVHVLAIGSDHPRSVEDWQGISRMLQPL
jgi:hypothetical protein